MKIVSITVGIKQGLPNYSSRSVEVAAVGDESESLDVVTTVRSLGASIKEAWAAKIVADPTPVDWIGKPATEPTTPPGIAFVGQDVIKSIDAELEKNATELGLAPKPEGKVVKLPKKAKKEAKPEPENFLAGLMDDDEPSLPVPQKKKISNPLDDEE